MKKILSLMFLLISLNWYAQQADKFSLEKTEIGRIQLNNSSSC